MKMNMKRLVLAALAAWVVALVIGYLVNGVLLSGLYQSNAAAFRPMAATQGLLPLGFVLNIAGFLALAWIYAKGYEGGSGLAEGMRFGLMMGIFVALGWTVWEYIMFPISRAIWVAWTIDSVIEMTIYGMVIGAVYRPIRMPARGTVSA